MPEYISLTVAVRVARGLGGSIKHWRHDPDLSGSQCYSPFTPTQGESEKFMSTSPRRGAGAWRRRCVRERRAGPGPRSRRGRPVRPQDSVGDSYRSAVGLYLVHGAPAVGARSPTTRSDDLGTGFAGWLAEAEPDLHTQAYWAAHFSQRPMRITWFLTVSHRLPG